jgi:hypothetical protein
VPHFLFHRYQNFLNKLEPIHDYLLDKHFKLGLFMPVVPVKYISPFFETDPFIVSEKNRFPNLSPLELNLKMQPLLNVAQNESLYTFEKHLGLKCLINLSPAKRVEIIIRINS